MPRILVIDDDPLIRSTIATILNREGFSVEEASDGQAGIAMFRKNPPEVVITDIFMPNRDGIEVVMELKRSYPQTKIIAMSGGGQTRQLEMIPAAAHLGADRTIEKPFDGQGLLAVIRSLLSEHSRSHGSVASDG